MRFNLLTLPSSRQADLRLALPARFNYEHAPLRQCVAQLAEHFQFSYWIDRRVDADRPITVAVADSTLRECLAKLAGACDAEIGLVENVVTIAKPEHLAAMQYAAVRLHNQLSLVQANENQASGANATNKTGAVFKALDWPQLATPAELADRINTTWQMSLAANMPHDLMNAGKLQPCTVSTQLSLLYGGFEQCAAGKRLGELKLLPMPKPGIWQATYPAGSVATEQVAIVKSKFADARLDKAGNSWTVVGPTAAHLKLLQPANRASSGSESAHRTPRSTNSETTADPFSKQRFEISKQTNQPLGVILKHLGDQLGLTIKWDNSLPPSAEHTLVTIEANKVRLDDILANLAQQAKLSISRVGTVVTIGKPSGR